ncbi:MAG: DciA family protein [Candidatus Uhrbacteria bacterium]|nr:DciA family protein [Candidatus Uhrbacteria bacterium]
MAKRPIGIGSLIESALGRHGIKRQVTAALVVTRVNESLQELLEQPLRDDVRAATFADGRLTLACRNASASYEIQPIVASIARKIEEEIPDITITGYDVRIKPELWREW